jgi:hypothetical protein
LSSLTGANGRFHWLSAGSANGGSTVTFAAQKTSPVQRISNISARSSYPICYST